MHLVLTGATGLVGSAVLDAMLKAKDITKITILSRRQVPMAEAAKDPRINVLLQEDFERYTPDTLEKLQGANGMVWALGISQTKVTKDEYIKITKTFAVAAAEAVSSLASPDKPFRFIYVSGAGATQSPGVFTPFFGGVKGETEVLLSALRRTHPGFLAEAVRPSVVDGSAHWAIKPYLPNPGFLYNILGAVFLAPTRVLARNYHAPTESFGRFLTEMAMGKFDQQLKSRELSTLKGGLRIVENVDFRQLAGL